MADFHHFRNQAKMRPKSSKNQWIAAFAACLGSISFGYMIGYSSPALPDMEWQGVLDKSQLTWFSSLVAIGAIPGCLFGGQLLEAFGRKWTIVISAIPYIIGWASILIASAAPIFYIGRFFTGFATGIVSTAVPVYLAEISTKESRGFFGALNQLGITFGILLVYALGLLFGYWNLAFIGLFGPIINALMMIMMPETPRWLMTHRTRNEAKTALAWLRSSYIETDRELAEMEETSATNQTFNIVDFLRPEVRRALVISVGLMVFQQLSGINAVMFNIVDMFLEAGFRESGALAATIVGVVQFIATILGCMVIEKRGRRFLLISTGLGMAVSCFIFAYYYHYDIPDEHSIFKFTPLFSLSLFIIAFSLGWGPVPSIVMSEVFSTKDRSVAASITVVANWILAFIVTKNYAYMKDSLGKDGVFGFFGIAIIVASLFVHYSLPETRGKSLEDIQNYFTGKIPSSTRSA